MSRRTKADLKKAQKRRLAKVKKNLNKSSKKKTAGNKQSHFSSQKKQSVPALFGEVFGYDFSLIKTDLTRTLAVTVIVSLILVAIVVIK